MKAKMTKMIGMIIDIINPINNYAGNNKIRVKKINFKKCSSCLREYSINSAKNIAKRNHKTIKCPHCYQGE